MFVSTLDDMPVLTEPALVVLDFAGIELATSSFLSELLIPLRDHLRFRRPPGYVVVANANEKVCEEMEDMLSRIGDAVLLAEPKTASSVGLSLLESLTPNFLTL